MECVINSINVEMEELVTSYKKSTTEFKHSLEKFQLEFQGSAQKSIDGISNALNDDLKSIAKNNSNMPRI